MRKLAQTRSLTLQVAGIVTCGTAMRALPTCCAACLVHTELALGDIEPAVPARHWATRALVAGVLGHEPPRWANDTAGIGATHRLIGAAAAEVRVELAQRAFPPARREVERVVRVRACNAEREHHVLDRPVTHETIERNRVAAGGTRRPLDQVCAVAALAERVALRAAARGHPQHEGADAAGEILVAARVDQHGVDHWLAVRELGSGCVGRAALVRVGSPHPCTDVPDLMSFCGYLPPRQLRHVQHDQPFSAGRCFLTPETSQVRYRSRNVW